MNSFEVSAGLFALPLILGPLFSSILFKVKKGQAQVICWEDNPVRWVKSGWHVKWPWQELSLHTCPEPGLWLYFEFYVALVAEPGRGKHIVKVKVTYTVGNTLNTVHCACLTNQDPCEVLRRSGVSILSKEFYACPPAEIRRWLEGMQLVLKRELDKALYELRYSVVGMPELEYTSADKQVASNTTLPASESAA